MNEDTTFTYEEKAKIDEIIIQVLLYSDKNKQIALIDELTKDCPHLKPTILKAVNMLNENPFINRKIGNYIIIRKLTTVIGGSATTYEAQHEVLKTLATVKIFDKFPDLLDDWEAEYSALANFEHDNIVKFYDTGIYESELGAFRYIIVEYINGRHFDIYCKEKNPSLIKLLTLFKDLCGVIEFIHSKDRPHLDLKPANILITEINPRVKLIDFGSSKFLKEKIRETEVSFYQPLTYKFASPEQIRLDNQLREKTISSDNPISQQEPDKKSDIFSLGIILYYLLTEKLPFGEFKTEKEKENLSKKERETLGLAEVEKLKAEVSDNTLSLRVLPSRRVLDLETKTKFGVSPRQLSTMLNGDIDKIIQKCLEKKKDNRYQEVSEIKQDIINFLDGKPITIRKNEFGYTSLKKFSHWLGIKGGMIGDEKWFNPLRKLSYVILIFMAIIVVSYGIYWGFFKKQYVHISKSIVKPSERMSLRLKVFNDKDKDFETREVEIPNLYIYCKEPGQPNKVCFNFFEIPATIAPFQMGKQNKDKFVDKNPDTEYGKKNNNTPASPGLKPGNESDVTNKPVNSLESSKPGTVDNSQTKLPDKETGYAQTSNNNEKPKLVKIPRFYMSRFEISIQQWNIVAKSEPSDLNIDLKVVNESDDNRSLPKTNITYSEAKEFCKRLSRDLTISPQNPVTIRLPSESEWEYACRAGNQSPFGAGNELTEDFGNVKNIAPDISKSERIVINKLSTRPLTDSDFIGNAYGLSAMNGNVWEMVSDRWQPNLDSVPEDGGSWDEITDKQITDLKSGDNKREMFVIKGGSFSTPAYMAQCSYRTNAYFVTPGNNQLSFRIVLEANKGLEEAIGPFSSVPLR